MLPDQIAHEFEVPAGVLVGPEARRQDLAGGVVDDQVQGQHGVVVAQPAMLAALDLDQHPLPGHALASYPVARRTPPPRALDTGRGQDAPQGLPGDPDPFAFVEQPGQVAVVGVRTAVPGRLENPGGDIFGGCVARATAAVAVGQGAGAALAVGGQQSPELAPADSRERCRRTGIDLVAKVAVKDLAPCAG